MEARHLLLLRELADRGSVGAVAAALNRTPSAVSQQLKAAAREADAVLVEPQGRGLRLTEAGLVLAAGGREVATSLARAQASWEEFRGEPRGTVSVAMLPSAALFLLPAAMAELGEQGIDLRCTDVDVAEVEFAGLAVDHEVVLGHSLTRDAPAGAAGLAARHLLREPLDIALPIAHRLATRPSVSPEDLVDEDWIGVPIGFPFDTVRLAVEQRTGRSLRVRQRLRDNRLVEALVRTGAGVAVLPRYTAPTEEGVVLRPLAGIPAGRHVFALSRPDRAERLVVRRVLDTFESVAATVPERGGPRPVA